MTDPPPSQQPADTREASVGPGNQRGPRFALVALAAGLLLVGAWRLAGGLASSGGDGDGRTGEERVPPTLPPAPDLETAWVAARAVPEAMGRPAYAIVHTASTSFDGAEYAVLGRRVPSSEGERFASLVLIVRQPLAPDRAPGAAPNDGDLFIERSPRQLVATRIVEVEAGDPVQYRIVIAGLGGVSLDEVNDAVRVDPQRLVVDEVPGLIVLAHDVVARSEASAQPPERTSVHWRAASRELDLVADPGRLPGVAGFVVDGHSAVNRGIVSGRETFWDVQGVEATVVTSTGSGVPVVVRSSRSLDDALAVAAGVAEVDETVWRAELEAEQTPIGTTAPEQVPSAAASDPSSSGTNSPDSNSPDTNSPDTNSPDTAAPSPRRPAVSAVRENIDYVWPETIAPQLRLVSFGVAPAATPSTRVRVVAVEHEDGHRLGVTHSPMPDLPFEVWGSPLLAPEVVAQLDALVEEGSEWQITAHRAGDQLHIRWLQTPRDADLAPSGLLVATHIDDLDLALELAAQARTRRWSRVDGFTLVHDFLPAAGEHQLAEWRVLPRGSLEMRFGATSPSVLLDAVGDTTTVTLVDADLGVWRVRRDGGATTGWTDGFVRPIPFGSLQVVGDADAGLMLDLFGSVDRIESAELASMLGAELISAPAGGPPS